MLLVYQKIYYYCLLYWSFSNHNHLINTLSVILCVLIHIHNGTRFYYFSCLVDTCPKFLSNFHLEQQIELGLCNFRDLSELLQYNEVLNAHILDIKYSNLMVLQKVIVVLPCQNEGNCILVRLYWNLFPYILGMYKTSHIQEYGHNNNDHTHLYHHDHHKNIRIHNFVKIICPEFNS